MPTHLNALPDGHEIHEYELERVLGSGGFGITYLGHDHNLDKPVAIKEYLPSDLAIRKDNIEVLAKSDTNQSDFDWGLDRFLEEARILARFDHRNLVKVYRFFEAHGTAYIVMEYVEGETLSQRLERGSLSEAEWLQMLNPLALGLIKVHKSNWLHRDIKPANTLIRTEDGSPVLVDFGAARMAIGAHSRSITAIVTPGYAPMEQYSSKGNQGPWTDIYALGAMSYKALTGTTPPDATDRVMDDELQPISQLNPNLSPTLAAAIERSLCIRPDERPQSVEAWQASWQGVSAIPDRAALDTSGDQAEVDPDNPNKIDEDGNTALIGAAAKGHTETIQVLIQAGSELNKAGKHGFTALISAAAEGHTETVQALIQAGSELNEANNYGFTALIGAAAKGHTETVQALIQAGADLNKANNHGFTALIGAAAKGHTETIQVLIQARAALNQVNKYGNTALISAAHEGHTETVQALIQARAALNQVNKYGNTALISAAAKGHTEIVRLLRAAGARE